MYKHAYVGEVLYTPLINQIIMYYLLVMLADTIFLS